MQLVHFHTYLPEENFIKIMKTSKRTMSRQKQVLLLLAAILFLACAAFGSYWYYKYQTRFINYAKSEPLIPVQSTAEIDSDYDTIVVGTDPEGIAAALSASRNGQRVLLVDGYQRTMLGGLMTEGGLNTIDFNYSPEQPSFLATLRPVKLLNKGIFEEWYSYFNTSSFDTTQAANRFYQMVAAEPNLDLLMGVQAMAPVVERSGDQAVVTGVVLTLPDGQEHTVHAGAVIDATQNADIAAAAGARFTVGRNDTESGGTQFMASTLVIKLSGVTQEAWNKMLTHGPDTSGDRMSIWGYTEARHYESTRPDRVKMRGLNIGRQNDGTILINSMQLFQVDPLDPQSVAEGLRVGQEEAPRIAEYLTTTFEEFSGLSYAGTASELYIRESRHLIGEYRLKLADVMENRVHWDDIAYGSYPIDIQSTSDGRTGTIMMKPERYGVPFRTLVPVGVDGLLVVGRSASFDSIPHGSARVIPLGMATGEAAGAAAAFASKQQISFREMSHSKELIGQLRTMLEKQGMDLTPHHVQEPAYLTHKNYKGLLAAASLYLTSGNYTNDGWALDSPANVQRFFNAVAQLSNAYPDLFPNLSSSVLSHLDDPRQQALDLSTATYILASSIFGRDQVTPDTSLAELIDRGWIAEETLSQISDPQSLTNGDYFMLIYDLSQSYLHLELDASTI